ncbi:SLC13 family permease [Thermovibrio sp.]
MKRFLLAVFLFLVSSLLTLKLNQPLEVKKGIILLEFGALFWITEALPLPITSLLIPIFAVFLSLGGVKEAFSSFAHPIIFLFFGGFALAAALSKYSLDKLVAYKIVSLSKGSFILTSLFLFLSTALVSMWISNTSTTAMMLPLALGLIGASSGSSRVKHFILLGVAYSASVGGIGTLVGSPPNGITAAELSMGFTDWLKFGLPIVAILFPLLFLILYLYFRPEGKFSVNLEKVDLNVGREGKLVLLVFLLTALGWLFSKPLSHLFGIHKYFDAVVAVLGVSLLFTLRLVNWREVEEGTDWGTLYLFGGGIALSHFLKTTGASKFIAGLLIGVVNGLPLFFIILITTLFMIFLTEIMSNTATAAIFVPILISAAQSLNIPPYLLALPAGVAASCAFMLPVATPPNAIVYGTGEVKQGNMVKVGLTLNLTFALVISLFFYFFGARGGI